MRRPPIRRFGRCEEASVTLDFVLTFPLFTMIVLVIVQFALMVNARLVVGYAAFAAARSAIVWTDGGEGEALDHHSRQAGALACMSISPGLAGEGRDQRFAVFLSHSFWRSGLDFEALQALDRRWRRAGSKYLYAWEHTHVEILGADARGRFRPKAPVTAVLTHDFYLNVPYAKSVLGRLLGERRDSDWVLPISDSSTLLNEGRIVTESNPGKTQCKGLLRGILDKLKSFFP